MHIFHFAQRLGNDGTWVFVPALWILLMLTQTPSAQAQSNAEEARAHKIANGVCFMCHGTEGESSTELFPKLAGQHAEYIVKQLKSFQSGARQSSSMLRPVSKLNEVEMLALGRYYENKPNVSEEVKQPALLPLGKKVFHEGRPSANILACATCHGSEAKGTEELPRLAGQFSHYIKHQLLLFKSGQRRNDGGVMQNISKQLSPQEIDAVSEYLSSK